MQSQDIRQLVQKEGKSARNLVTWSVSATDVSPESNRQESSDGFTPVTKKTRRNKERGRGRGNGYSEHSRRQKHAFSSSPILSRSSKKGTPPFSGSKVSEEVCVVMAGHYSDMHAKQRQSRTSKPPGSRVDLHARYWSYLFDNLHRAVDEIYTTCEADESVIECQEVIMTLEQCQKDFVALIRRFELFEQQQLQPKKSNLAWEVRKTTSPIKPRSQVLLRRSLSPSASSSHRLHPHSPPSHPKTQVHPQHHHSYSDTHLKPHHPHSETSSQPHHPHSETSSQPHRPHSDTPSQPAAHTNSTHNEDASTESAPVSNKPSKDSKPNVITSVDRDTLRADSNPDTKGNSNTDTTGTKLKHSYPTSQTEARLGSKQETTATNRRPNLPARPSSARSLDFSSCSSEGRVGSPLLKRSKSHGKVDSESRTRKLEEKKNGTTVSTGPTWADRVRGVAKPVTASITTNNEPVPMTTNGPMPTTDNAVPMATNEKIEPDGVSVAASEEEVKGVGNTDEGSDLEDGWERVTRFRSRSTSSIRSGNHTHKHSAKDVRTKSKKPSESSTGRSNFSTPIESSTPPVFDVEERSAEQEDKMADSSAVGVGEKSTEQEDKMADSSAVGVEERSAKQEDEIADSSAVGMEKRSTEPEDKMADSSTVGVEEKREGNMADNFAVDASNDAIPLKEVAEIVQVKMEGKKKIPKESVSSEKESWSWNDVVADYEAGETCRQEMSWADRCDSPPETLPEIPRSPGRAIHLHQRLSSPSRKSPSLDQQSPMVSLDTHSTKQFA